MELAKEMLDAACDHNVATMNITVLCDDSYSDMCRKALNDLEGRPCRDRRRIVQQGEHRFARFGCERVENAYRQLYFAVVVSSQI